MDSTGLVGKIRDYRFQAIVGLVALVAALLVGTASERLAFGIVALGVIAVVFLSWLDHRYRTSKLKYDEPGARSVKAVALGHLPVEPAEMEIEHVTCTIQGSRRGSNARTEVTEAYLGPGGWMCPLPEMGRDELLTIEFTDARGARWRVPRFDPGDLTPRLEARRDIVSLGAEE